MRKTTASALAMFSIILLLSTSLTPSLATDYTKIGVKVGDLMDYSFASSDSKMNGAVAHVFVQSIEGTIVSINGTILYSNGTAETESIGGDVSKGQNNSYYFLICANLTQGDPIYIGSQTKITETINATVLGVSRVVNHMESGFIITSFDVYWDKISGLMVKLSASGFGQWLTVTMTNTSVWSPSSQPPGGTGNNLDLGQGSANGTIGDLAVLLIIGGVVVAVVITAVVVLRRRRK